MSKILLALARSEGQVVLTPTTVLGRVRKNPVGVLQVAINAIRGERLITALAIKKRYLTVILRSEGKRMTCLTHIKILNQED